MRPVMATDGRGRHGPGFCQGLSVLFGVGLIAFGCGGTTTSHQCQGTAAECAAATETSGTDGTGAIPNGTGPSGTDGTGIDTSIPDGTDIVCTGGAEGNGGGYPFTGLSIKPESPKASGATYNFTCTMCPGGTLGVKGKYKYFIWEGDTAKPNLPEPSEWAETLEFDGNHFINVLEGVDSVDSEKKTVTAAGYYFCPKTEELQDIKYKDYWNTVWVYTDAAPAGGFGISAGAVDLCFLGVNASPLVGANDIRVECNLFWDPAGTSQAVNHYCRLNSELDGRKCENPFEQ